MASINHDHRHIFPHVPKTAGTSMESVEWVGGFSHRPLSKLLVECKNQIVRWHEGCDLSQYTRWAFVRDPMDRLLSVYMAYRQHRQRVPLKATNLPFHEFVDWLAEAPHDGVHRHLHLRPQAFWVDEPVDFLGRFETLTEDWATICEMVVGKVVDLPHHNSTDRPTVDDVYDQESADAVRSIYAADYEAFEYQ